MAINAAAELLKGKLRQKYGRYVNPDIGMMSDLGRETAEGLIPSEVAGSKIGMLDRLKGEVPGLIFLLAMNRLMKIPGERGERALRREAIRAQGVTPDDLYYQAALPQAQQEEAEARQALITHLSGGVVGPSIATGERMIGA
jgi:hypothetical protein